MKNEITTMPVNDIMTMAKTFVESGMFADTKQAAQAFVKIQAGQEIGLAPFASMSGINIILGKPTFGAGVIASCVKGSAKYDFKVKELSDKLCSIDFFEGKDFIGNSTFTIEDAKKQNTKNLDKFPKNMLYARAISNGQKWFCPDVFQMSVYVPEEMPEQTEDINHVEVIEIDFEDAILNCETLEELTQVFKSIPKEKQKDFKEIATKQKELLTEKPTAE